MNITILAICTVLCICAGGRGVCKLVYHHIPNTKLTQRDDNIIASRIAISYLHTDTRERASVLCLVQGVKRYRTLRMRKSTSLQRLSRKCVQIFFRPGPGLLRQTLGVVSITMLAALSRASRRRRVATPLLPASSRVRPVCSARPRRPALAAWAVVQIFT